MIIFKLLIYFLHLIKQMIMINPTNGLKRKEKHGVRID